MVEVILVVNMVVIILVDKLVIILINMVVIMVASIMVDLMKIIARRRGKSATPKNPRCSKALC